MLRCKNVFMHAWMLACIRIGIPVHNCGSVTHSGTHACARAHRRNHHTSEKPTHKHNTYVCVHEPVSVHTPTYRYTHERVHACNEIPHLTSPHTIPRTPTHRRKKEKKVSFEKVLLQNIQYYRYMMVIWRLRRYNKK